MFCFMMCVLWLLFYMIHDLCVCLCGFVHDWWLLCVVCAFCVLIDYVFCLFCLIWLSIVFLCVCVWVVFYASFVCACLFVLYVHSLLVVVFVPAVLYDCFVCLALYDWLLFVLYVWKCVCVVWFILDVLIMYVVWSMTVIVFFQK